MIHRPVIRSGGIRAEYWLKCVHMLLYVVWLVDDPDRTYYAWHSGQEYAVCEAAALRRAAALKAGDR
jgi:hypothetical protein